MANKYVRLGDVAVLKAMDDEDLLSIMRLFKNDHVPTEADVIGDYTVANFSGYPGDKVPVWGAPIVNGANKGEMTATAITYTVAAGGVTNTVYGAYFVDTHGILIYADRFPAPIVMGTIGDTFTYTPRTTAVTE